jgi:hypothetical protein
MLTFRQAVPRDRKLFQKLTSGLLFALFVTVQLAEIADAIELRKMVKAKDTGRLDRSVSMK